VHSHSRLALRRRSPAVRSVVATPATVLLPALLSATAACADASDQLSIGAVVRDSAGITIVESGTPLWTTEDAWRVPETPLVDIGEETEDLDYLFERINGVVLLPNNDVAVADGGASQLRLYDSLGYLKQVVGAHGSGPGEFRGLAVLQRYRRDSLLAFDYRNRRYSVFGADLTFARSFTMVLADVPAAWPVSVFSDGTLLLKVLDFTEIALPLVGPYRHAEVLFRYDHRTDSLEEIARPPGREFIAIPYARSAIPDMIPHPFGNESAAGAVDDGFFTANSDTYEVHFFNRDRELTRIVRRSGFDGTLSDAEEAAARAYFASIWGPPQPEGSHPRAWLRVLDDMEFPESRPAFGRFGNPGEWPVIQVDSEGHVWLLRYLAPGEGAQRWDVFGTTGAWLGTVDLPERFTPLDIGSDRLAGVWRDPDGVDHLRVYALERPL
jgi:hypothetical protein